MGKNRFLIYIILLFSFFLVPKNVLAGSATIGFEGSSSVRVGDTIKVSIYVSNISGTTDDLGVVSVGGVLNFDKNYLQYVSFARASAPYEFDMNDTEFIIAGVDSTFKKGIKTKTSIMSFTFKVLKEGTTSITLNNAKTTDPDGKLTTTVVPMKINILAPLNSNNDLASLSLDKASISFNKNTTTYNVSVDGNVSSITVNAAAEDNKASVTGVGTKQLNYGNNTISIVVKAENGSKKTYTINVNRKDDRSGNANLSKLSIQDGNLSPAFSPDVTSYKASVPYSVENLKINAEAADSKTTIKIENQNNLIAEETTDVKIILTSENGSKKIYTISVTRGKNPNKVLATNNYLDSLSVSKGILSPAFNKDQQNYIVYLPYEIDNISIQGSVSDKKYGKLQINGPEKLTIGKNQYSLKVTAEDESTREYIVTVMRGENLGNKELSSNIYLKEIIIENGNIKKDFDKTKFVYHYTKGKNFTINPVPEDENSSVEMYNNDDIITILVKSESGEVGVYTLILYSFPIMYVIFSTVIVALAGIIIYLMFIKKEGFKSVKNKH